MIKSVIGDDELGDESVRPRVHPYLNINATNLTDLIDWDGATEPIITCQITTAELEKFRESPMEVEYFPCHTQMIERAVKEVTAAAGTFCEAEQRDGFIRGRAKHVEMVPKINSKHNFFNNSNISLK